MFYRIINAIETNGKLDEQTKAKILYEVESFKVNFEYLQSENESLQKQLQFSRELNTLSFKDLLSS